MRKFLTTMFLLLTSFLTLSSAQAEDYAVDIKGTHAFIQFRIQHLGYSWLHGRFNKFDGNFSYDEKDPSASTVNITIDVSSIDSNHSERDKHLRGGKFLQANKFGEATFTSTSFEETTDGNAILKGDFTLHGITKPMVIDVKHVGHGDDPWGGYRRGFTGTTSFMLGDYGIQGPGPASQEIFLDLSLEGIRK